MNHFKTFILIQILGAFFFNMNAPAALDRPLKPDEINKLQDNIQKKPDNVKSRLFLGNHYYREKNWNQVIHHLAPVTEKLPDEALYVLSESYLAKGLHREAESIANILLSKEPISTKHYLLVVEIYSLIYETITKPELKGPARANIFETLKTAQKMDPENPEVYEVWLKKTEAYIDQYAFDTLRIMEDMKKNNIPFEPRHLSLQCKYNFLAGFTKQTKLTCQKAIVQEPDNPSNYIYLGQTRVNIGDEVEGKRILASVGKKFSSSEEALWASANSYYESKNISAAYLLFKKASQHKDSKPRDLLGLAKTAFELKKYQEALVAFVQHCHRTKVLDQEFRRASGMLKDQLEWHELYRKKMLDCKPATDDPAFKAV